MNDWGDKEAEDWGDAPVESRTDDSELKRLRSRQQARLAQNFRGAGSNVDKNKDYLFTPAFIGAKHGFDRAALGLKGLFTELSDEDKQQLAQGAAATEEGGGLGTFGQVAGEIAATGGPAALARKGAARVLPQALKRLSAPGVAGGVGARVLTPGTVAGSAVEGAAAGSILAPGEGESRLENAAAGGALGAAVPAVGATVAPAARWLWREFAPTSKAQGVRAARTLEETLGPDTFAKAVDDVRNPTPTSLPLSTAALSENPALARLERGARNRSGGFEWDEHDAAVYRQAWDQLQQALRQGEDATLLTQQADELVKGFKGKMDSLPLADRYREQLARSLTGLKNSNEALADPAVMKEIDNALVAVTNPGATVGVLPQLWFKMGEMAGQSSAVSGARDVVRKTLDTRTKGGFSQMLDGYGAIQDQLKGANAALKIQDDFMSPQGVVRSGRAFPSGQGTQQVPEIQAKVLRQSIAKEGEQGGVDVLGGQSRAELDELTRNLGRHDLYRGNQTPGSTSLNNGNLMDIAATGRNNPIYTVPGLRGFVGKYVERFNRETEETLNRALRNPEEFLRMISIKEGLGRPLSEGERTVRQLLLAQGRAAGSAVSGDSNAP